MAWGLTTSMSPRPRRARFPLCTHRRRTPNAVAEHALTLMLSLARQVFPSSQALREGRFKDRAKFQGVELAGKTLGVLGLGRIGLRVAEMARDGLAMKVLAYDQFVEESDFELAPSLDVVLRAADFLTLHLPLTEETRHLLDGERLQMLKPGCRIINTSRGAVIDERALVEALQVGRVSGAALDVFEDEPLQADHPLCRAPNTLLTPHISSSTAESLDRMACDAAQGVLDVLPGKAACPRREPQGAALSHWIDITRPMGDSMLCWPGRQPPEPHYSGN